ncbi:MAG: shikimate kinase [Thermoanaerobaculia bacterium]
MHIFVTGFMGVGKSTVGRCLAAALELPFVDLDEEIESRTGESIASVFDQRGEAAFRQQESEVLAAIVRRPPAVIATGGGTVTSEENRVLMEAHGVSVWIDLPFASIARRVVGEEQVERPLFEDRSQAHALFQARLSAYQACNLRIAVKAEDGPEKIAAKIQQQLQETPCAT